MDDLRTTADLVQARIERNVYKELYEKLIGSMMAK